ncbi:MAG: DUF732 domain-containing protein [Bryobacteraceae bacterium]
MFRLIAMVSAAIAAAMVVAAPVHADDQSYLNYLQAHGANMTFPGPGQYVMFGHMICTNLHNGADPLAGGSPIDRATWGPAAVDAAQHELCPDTLH